MPSQLSRGWAFSPAEVKCRRWQTFLCFHGIIYHRYNALCQEFIKAVSVLPVQMIKSPMCTCTSCAGPVYLQHSMPAAETKGINPLGKCFPIFHSLRKPLWLHLSQASWPGSSGVQRQCSEVLHSPATGPPPAQVLCHCLTGTESLHQSGQRGKVLCYGMNDTCGISSHINEVPGNNSQSELNLSKRILKFRPCGVFKFWIYFMTSERWLVHQHHWSSFQTYMHLVLLGSPESFLSLCYFLIKYRKDSWYLGCVARSCPYGATFLEQAPPFLSTSLDTRTALKQQHANIVKCPGVLLHWSLLVSGGFLI